MQDFSGEKRGVCAGYVGNLAKSQRSHSSFSPIVRTLNNFSVFFTVTRLCCQTRDSPCKHSVKRPSAIAGHHVIEYISHVAFIVQIYTKTCSF